MLVAGLAGLVVYAWLAVQVYLAQRDPEAFLKTWTGTYSWILGPPPSALNRAAEERIREGLDALNDGAKAPQERLETYRAQLRRAEALLVRSLRANAAQAGALSHLAAIRWELEAPQTEEAIQRHLDMIAVASKMAPSVPLVQMRLGELLLKMGRPENALEYLRRAVELDGNFAARVVTALRESLFAPEEMLEALPRSTAALAALQQPFVEDGRAEAYLAAIDSALPGDGGRLLVAYGNACTALGDGDRLLGRMDALGTQRDSRTEAERLTQRSRALVTMKRWDEALEAARAARRAQPGEAWRARWLAQVALGAGRGDESVAAAEAALSILARGGAGPAARAGLYDLIGQAEEKRGRPDRAFDAYKRAVALDDKLSHAAERLRAMRAAAGT